MKTKILIVDDYLENIQALSALIASDDVETHSAMNAEEALELISQHEFGLALLDVQMPGTNGFELAKIIRSVRKYRNLPIIFVTAQSQESSLIFQGYETGAVDLLFKPLDPDVVRAKVRMFVDLAQQKEMLEVQVQELNRLRKDADAANLAKSQFLANMSHEIRTPLAAVMGFAELITRGNSTDQEKDEFVQAVKRNGKLLMRLIDDILDLSKVEANKFEIERDEFCLFELLEEVQTTMSFRANEKGISLQFQIPNKLKYAYISDPVRIKQVLLNIIGNAIKFSSGGTVSVDVDIKPENKAGAIQAVLEDRVTVLVRDPGIGLTKEQVEKLFQPFGQGDSSTNRKYGGSGLGLIISRQITRKMGGDIKLLSTKPGEGSLFRIDFLLERSKDQENTTSFSKKRESIRDADFTGAFEKMRVLVVDDSPDNLTLVSYFLKGTGAKVIFADSGSNAINEINKGDVDLVLMDIQMPDMDGHAATSVIRKLGYKKPIIALTAHALKTEHEKCRISGCDSVLTKPVDRRVLLKELSAHFNRSSDKTN